MEDLVQEAKAAEVYGQPTLIEMFALQLQWANFRHAVNE